MDLSNIFHAFDVRGVYGQDLTLDIAKRIGKAVGTLYEGEEFVIGSDTRASSPMLYRAFAEGLASTGVNVIYVGTTPSPLAYFNGFIRKLDGAQITASHNPPQFNGIKMFHGNGVSYSYEGMMSRIKQLTESGKFREGAGRIENVDDGFDDYVKYLKERIKINEPIGLAAECFHGSGALLTPKVFQAFGIDCIPVGNDIKADFGGMRPEPKGANMERLRTALLKGKADFGVAFDGDADRSVFLDENGKEYIGSYIGLLLAKDALKGRKGNIIATLDVPSASREIVERAGGKLIKCNVGHTCVEEELFKRSEERRVGKEC
jgi:phosphomannomutase